MMVMIIQMYPSPRELNLAHPMFGVITSACRCSWCWAVLHQRPPSCRPCCHQIRRLQRRPWEEAAAAREVLLRVQGRCPSQDLAQREVAQQRVRAREGGRAPQAAALLQYRLARAGDACMQQESTTKILFGANSRACAPAQREASSTHQMKERFLCHASCSAGRAQHTACCSSLAGPDGLSRTRVGGALERGLQARAGLRSQEAGAPVAERAPQQARRPAGSSACSSLGSPKTPGPAALHASLARQGCCTASTTAMRRHVQLRKLQRALRALPPEHAQLARQAQGRGFGGCRTQDPIGTVV